MQEHEVHYTCAIHVGQDLRMRHIEKAWDKQSEHVHRLLVDNSIIVNGKLMIIDCV